MPKKRKKGPTKSKGRRVGALAMDQKVMLKRTAGVVAGVVGARFLETYATKQLTSISPKMVAGMEVAIGGITAYMAKDPFVQGVGMGLAAAGGANLTKTMGLIAGIGEPLVFNTKMRRVAGTGNGSGIPMIGQNPVYYNVPRVGAGGNGNAMYASRPVIGRSRVSGLTTGQLMAGGTM